MGPELQGVLRVETALTTGICPCPAATNPNTPKNRNVRLTTSRKVMKRGASQRGKRSGALGPPSTRTTPAARSRVDRGAARVPDFRQPIKGAGSVANPPPRDPQLHVQPQPRRPLPRASVAATEYLKETEHRMKSQRPSPPFPKQKQPMPGLTGKMTPRPDHGENNYQGSGRLKGKKTVITGGDSGIGRAVAIAYAREGSDILISYLHEHEDAEETKRHVEAAGRKAILVSGDIGEASHCRAIVQKAVTELGGIDILVNNAAHQASFKDIGSISDEEWDLTFRVNIHAMFYLAKAAVPHMKPGSAIINTASINSDTPNPTLLAYATTKGAIQNFTAGLAQLLAEKGIRANAVAPGPIWTPLIPSTLPEDSVENFGKQVPMKRPGQPAELATAFVMLADPLSSYVSGATIAVTGGKPIL